MSSKVNLLFFINGYNDLCQTSTPYLSAFKWTREINGIPYTSGNSQQLQVLANTTSNNIIPSQFSTPTNSGTYTVNNTNILTVNSTTDGIAVDQLIVGGSIPVGTTVSSIGLTTYTFTVTSANATVGAVYSNNGINLTVTSTIVAGTTLICTGLGDPQSSGELALVSGTGDATIVFSSFTETTPITMSAASSSSGGVGISFFNASTFTYLESDQPVSVIYNNGVAASLKPFEINGITQPGVFFMAGPATALTVTNSGAITANVFLVSIG